MYQISDGFGKRDRESNTTLQQLTPDTSTENLNACEKKSCVLQDSSKTSNKPEDKRAEYHDYIHA